MTGLTHQRRTSPRRRFASGSGVRSYNLANLPKPARQRAFRQDPMSKTRSATFEYVEPIGALVE